jgi:hypothetical protein
LRLSPEDVISEFETKWYASLAYPTWRGRLTGEKAEEILEGRAPKAVLLVENAPADMYRVQRAATLLGAPKSQAAVHGRARTRIVQ